MNARTHLNSHFFRNIARDMQIAWALEKSFDAADNLIASDVSKVFQSHWKSSDMNVIIQIFVDNV